MLDHLRQMTFNQTVSQHPEFPLRDDVVYLNHAGVAPWPKRTAEAVGRFAAENVARGAQHYPMWLEVEADLRERLRCLLNAESATDIALLKNTSEALSVIAYGLDWKPGDAVVLARQEFPSNRIVWESLRARGVEVRIADLDAAASPEDALIELCDERTRLLAVSSVQYGTGLRMDLEALGRACRARGVLFCLDAIQSLGALRYDQGSVQADFVVADGHKWMLGPEGVALFYCRPELRERLRLLQYGWHMVERMGEYDRLDWQPAASARRFECGSPNMLGIHALHASLGLLLETGMDEVERAVLARSTLLVDEIRGCSDFELLTPSEEQRRTGIVTFRHRRVPPMRLHAHLTANGVVCAQRAGGVRFSPHFHNSIRDLERALAIASACPTH
jgi:cysteine desulfurase / selenocysteine lyase